MKPNIALTGLARAGKDSVAARLVSEHGYVRVAFADKLKESALRADPFICGNEREGNWARLSYVVGIYGWERAKDDFPEVRRFLQEHGQAVRELDPMFWVRAALPAMREAWDAGQPVVITDVRYANEADWARKYFDLIRVMRPGQTPGQHRSEREMLEYDVPNWVWNDGSLEDLARKVDRLVL